MSNEMLVTQENVSEFAAQTFSLYRTAERLANGQMEGRLPTDVELQSVRDLLIAIWEQIGIDGASENLKQAFDPLFSKEQEKERYGIAHERLYALNKVKSPYEVKSGLEFLQMLKHPEEMKKFLAADISEYIRYSFLHSFDTYVNPPPPKKPNDHSDDDHSSFFHSGKEPNTVHITEEEQNAALLQFESGEFPRDVYSKTPGFMEAYKNVLHSNAIYVIGCDNIRWEMAKGQDYATAVSKLKTRALRISAAQQHLLKLEKVSAKYRPNMIDDIKMYERLAEEAGPHSKLGKFYRSVAKRFSALLDQKHSAT